MTVALLLAVFLAGALAGILATARNTHRLVARLSPLERAELARRVARHTDRSRA